MEKNKYKVPLFIWYWLYLETSPLAHGLMQNLEWVYL